MDRRIVNRSWCVLALVALLASVAIAQSTIKTVAGGGPNNLPVTSSAIGLPWSVVQFNNGGKVTTYISDNFTNRVFAVDPSGTLTVVAGNIVATFGDHTHDGFAATEATLNGPEQVAVDSSGNLYIADTRNHAIRSVNVSSGIIQTIVGVAGTPCTTQPSCGDGGPATSANLTSPGGVWLDSNNNIYIADTGDDVVRVVNTQSSAITIAGVANIQPGNIATIAGTYHQPCTGAPCGDGGAGTSATLTNPAGVWLDGSNDIYIADTGDDGVRLLNATSGTITRIAGNYGAPCSVSPCGDGGSALTALLKQPTGVFGDGSGDLYIADTGDEVVRVVSGGNINLVAGTYFTACSTSPCGDGGSATSAQLASPTGVFSDGSGNLLIADNNDDAIRQVASPLSSPTISTTMGLILNPEYSGDAKPPSVPGSPTDASLYKPTGVAKDAAGNIYIADSLNSVVREVSSAGVITTFAGTGSFCKANNPTCGDGDPPTSADLSGPTGVAVDSFGNVYIVDAQDSIIRVVNTQKVPITVGSVTNIPAGTIKTVAGDISLPPGYNGDGKSAVSSQLQFPVGMTLDSAGNIYIADGNLTASNSNNIIRVVNTQSKAITVAGVTIQPGNMNIIAGTPQSSCTTSTDPCGDGGPAKSATLNGPTGVAVDTSGNVYIADNNDNRIRAVNSEGTIKTVAGTGNFCQGACGDNAPATAATLSSPYDVLVDYNGTVYIGDAQDYQVRVVNPGASSIMVDGITVPPGYINTVAGLGSHGFSGDGGPATAAQLAAPSGLGADSAGNLLVTDTGSWRVRSVQNLVATAPTASLSPGLLDFSATVVDDTSKATITITNNGNVTDLVIKEPLTISGTNASDFSETDNCNTPVKPLGGTCTVTVSFTPTAAGSRSATLAITDNAGNSPQMISLSGTGVAAPSFTIPAPSPSTQSVAPGSSANYTISLSAQGGFSGSVTLACLSGLPSGAACTFSPNPIKAGQSSTLTITTTGSSASLTGPALNHRQAPLYAVWLLLPAMLLSSAGLTAPKRRKLISCFLLMIAVAGVLFLVACGGSSSTGGSGSGGTPAGTYIITIQGTSGGVVAKQTVTLTVS